MSPISDTFRIFEIFILLLRSFNNLEVVVLKHLFLFVI